MLKEINRLVDRNQNGIEISDTYTIIGQISKDSQFFDTIFSSTYFCLLLPIITQSADVSFLARSPADYIMFDDNKMGIVANKWLSRTQLIEILCNKNIKDTSLPSFHSLKICSPGMTIYQVLSLVTPMVTCFQENEVQDNLFFKGLREQKNPQFMWNNLPIIQIETEL